MSRHAHEFQCTECSYYNYPMLDESMHGNYTILCGQCGHKHYRVVEKGVVTSDRHSEKYGTTDVIHVMPSACQQTKRQLGLIAQLRQRAAAGLLSGGE